MGERFEFSSFVFVVVPTGENLDPIIPNAIDETIFVVYLTTVIPVQVAFQRFGLAFASALAVSLDASYKFIYFFQRLPVLFLPIFIIAPRVVRPSLTHIFSLPLDHGHGHFRFPSACARAAAFPPVQACNR